MDEFFELEKESHINLFYGDEVGFSLNCVIPYCWQFPNEQVAIVAQKGKTLNVLGFMNSQGNQVFTYDKQGSTNSEFVINSIDDFTEKLQKPTVLVLDNARIHHSIALQSRIMEWQEKGLYLFYLPPYSPHLNRIETLWRHTKYRWIKPSDYKDLDTLKKALDKIWSSFGSDYQINFSKNLNVK